MWLCMKWHGACLCGVHRRRRDGSSFTWHQPRNNRALKVHHFSGCSKRALKIYSHSFRITSDKSPACQLESGDSSRYVKAINNNTNNSKLGTMDQTWQPYGWVTIALRPPYKYFRVKVLWELDKRPLDETIQSEVHRAYTHAKRSHTHVEDSAVHIRRVWWIMETLE